MLRAYQSKERRSKSPRSCTAWVRMPTIPSPLRTLLMDERKEYVSVIAKLDGFFQVRRNVIFERARFNRCVEKEGESTKQFITSLYNLVETCAFGDLKDEMIRDRIVVRIWDQALSECLQTVADLTLEKAKTLVRQREAVHDHQLTLNGSSKVEKSLDSVQKQAFNSRGKGQTSKKKGQAASKSPTTKCTRCGRGDLRSVRVSG